MEGVGSEVSQKIRSAIKAKLVELGTYVGKDVTLQLNEELPDYIMVLVANKKTKDQMDDDLSLFLGHNTERFTSWLHHVLQKLNAAALLQVTTPQEEPKKKEVVEEKKKDKDDKREKVDKKREVPIEEMKKSREEERHSSKEKDKISRKRKTSEKKKDKKEKKLKRKDSSPPPERESKERRVPAETAKPVTKPRELSRELESRDQEVKEKKSKEIKERENKVEMEKENKEKEVKESKEKETKADKEKEGKENSKKKLKPLTTGNKVSSADIFRAEAGGEDEEVVEEDMLVLRAEDELGLDLEEEPTPKKSRGESREKVQQKGMEVKPVVKEVPKVESELKEKKQRVSVKERLGAPVTSKVPACKDKVSVMSRVSVGVSGRRVVNLREDGGVGSGSRREEAGSEGTAGSNAGLARAVSSAITSACRSVCVLPSTTASGKKLEARVRPLMSREVVSNASGGGTARTSSRESSSRSEAGREGIKSEVASNKEGSSNNNSRGGETSSRESSRVGAAVRAGSSRVVSAVGAVLKRSHSQVESDEEEYDPKKPQLAGMASKVEVAPRPRRLGAIQANTALILRAVADAHKSVTRPPAHQPKSQKPVSKVKGELFTRSYREREEARQKEVRVQEEGPEMRVHGEGEEVRIRKIAITVPNAARKESERQLKEEEMKEEEEERPQIPETLSVKKDEEQQLKPEEQLPEMSASPLTDNVYNVEEMEEVEEEEMVVEMSPPVMTPEPATMNENTKFIVTLEGVDEGGDLRERLGNRLPQTHIEEFIEEVEEWEEEEEEITSDSGSIQPTPGLGAGKNANSALPVTHDVSKERCKYWPSCKSGDTCPYHHPTVPCRSFPACKYGDKCLFIHPNCLYDGACTRIGCPYTHASARNFALASAAASQKHKVMAPRSGPSKVKCKFFPKCTNMSCPFLHPKACFYGTSCTQAGCPFTHPAIPTGAKLKWVAPKIASAATTATALTTAKDTDK